MSQPVELIVTNTLHDLAEKIEALPPALATTIRYADLSVDLTRTILCHIAHEARIDTVVKLLEAAGVCGGVDGVAQRLTAVREARAAEAAPRAPKPAAAPASEAPGADAPSEAKAWASEAPKERLSGVVIRLGDKS